MLTATAWRKFIIGSGARVQFPAARILVFAKAPVPGKVKTRLISRYGAKGAAAIQKNLVNNTLHTLSRAQLSPVELWCAPDCRHGFFRACRRNYRLALKIQRGADLGQRMHYALRISLRQCAYAVLIGADCPSLGVAEMRQALHSLHCGKEAVLGPAQDGGYVLIGMRKPCSAVFRGMRWGSASVLNATRRRLRRSGLRWSELATGWDVDYPADVRRYRRWQEG